MIPVDARVQVRHQHSFSVDTQFAIHARCANRIQSLGRRFSVERIAVRPAAVLRCTMASALAAWIRSDIAPLADSRAMRIAALDNFDSFDCRGRNRVATAKLSEHGRANALDLRGLKLANGRLMALTDRNTAREVREKVRASACARFMTVLGPGSDGYHENHIHLDLAERRSGYRICHWDIERAPGGQAETATSTQPMPPPRAAAAARPLPVARPSSAPSSRHMRSSNIATVGLA